MFAHTAQPVATGRQRSGPRLTGMLRAGAAVLALGVLHARADPDLGRVVAQMPLSVDFVAAVDDGARLRDALNGSPVLMGLAGLNKPTEVLRAWSALADEMGMGDGEAFDLLLGQRAIVVGANTRADATEPPSWAVLSEIDPATERRLRARLGAVPRTLVRGQPVLEFEHGSFLLASSTGRLRCTTGGAFENTPASSIMLMAPASDRALFERMLPLLRCESPPSRLADLPAGRALQRWQTREAVLLWRLPDTLNWPDRFVAATAGPEGRAWRVQALLSPAGGWLPGGSPLPEAAWSPAMLDRLPPEPALAVMGSRRAIDGMRAWIDPMIASPLPTPAQDELSGLLGPRSMLAVWIEDDRSECEVLLATETPSLRRLAPRADAYMRESVGPDADGENTSVVRTPPELTDIRHMRLPDEADRDSRSMSWVFVPGPAELLPAAGWWVMHFDPAGRAGSAVVGQGDAAPEPHPARRYLHVGRADPARWAPRARRALSAALAAVPDDREAGGAIATLALNELVLSHIDHLSWAVWHEADERGLRVEVNIGLRSAPADADTER